MTPLELFEVIRSKALTMSQAAFMESGKPWPEDEGTIEFMKTMLGIGIAASTEHFAQHPEHIALAGQPICEVCREPVQSWQVGVDPARDPEQQTDPIKVSWPCGHVQPWTT